MATDHQIIILNIRSSFHICRPFGTHVKHIWKTFEKTFGSLVMSRLAFFFVCPSRCGNSEMSFQSHWQRRMFDQSPPKNAALVPLRKGKPERYISLVNSLMHRWWQLSWTSSWWRNEHGYVTLPRFTLCSVHGDLVLQRLAIETGCDLLFEQIDGVEILTEPHNHIESKKPNLTCECNPLTSESLARRLHCLPDLETFHDVWICNIWCSILNMKKMWYGN